MNRKDFLKTLFKPHHQSFSDPLSLDPYEGAWGQAEALHLLRRTTFGCTPDQVKWVASLGMDEAVDMLLDPGISPPAPPVNVYSTPGAPDPDAPYGSTWVNAPFNPALPPEYIAARMDALKAWWTGLMIQGPLHIREKMTLFWHNHFAVEGDTVLLAQGMYHYLALLRSESLGNFRNLTKAVSIDPAMLFYLNGHLNAKAQPDENYARELLELFTLGKGTGSQYTEQDVKAAARVLTGYRINPFSSPISFFFDFTQHDTGNKTFSAYFNQATISGKIGPAGAGELDELLGLIFAKNEVSRHICRKLYQFFVYYRITPEVEAAIIEPLAALFRNSQYAIRPVIDTLLRSTHFYDASLRGCIIKSPLDFTVGLSRQFAIPYPPAQPDPLPLYLTWGVSTAYAAAAGLHVLDPPVVAGWPAWYQAPMYHRIWINSDTLASRFLLIHALTGNGVDIGGTPFKLDPIPFAASLTTPVDPNSLVEEAAIQLMALPISSQTRDYYKSYLLGGLDDSYWSSLWLSYQADPTNPAHKNAVTTRLSALFREMMVQAEFHLC